MALGPFKKRGINYSSVLSDLTGIMNQRPNNLHITIFIDDQVLFQLIPARNFKSYGFIAQNGDDLSEVHFFNKNKTKTLYAHPKLQSSQFSKSYFYYENPKGNHNYLKTVGQNPKDIANSIMTCFNEIYDLSDLNYIRIEYQDY